MEKEKKKTLLTEEQITFKKELDKRKKFASRKLGCPVDTTYKDNSFTIKITSTAENYERIIEALGLNGETDE